MDPERVLADSADRTMLLASLDRLAQARLTAEARHALFAAAGVTLPTVQLGGTSYSFAESLLAAFILRPVAEPGSSPHPMVTLLQYLLNNGVENYGLTESDADRFQNLIDQAGDRSAALLARRSVGCIEDALRQGIGTGSLIAPQALLVARHVIDKTRATRAWVRFDYTSLAARQTSNLLFELDLSHLGSGAGSAGDFALVPIIGQPMRPILPAVHVELNSGDEVRMIHHPQGKPAVVSGVGHVRHVANDYLLHDIPADHGSSGAPIFNRHWQLVGIHRGDSTRTQPGTAEGVPLEAFWLSWQEMLSPRTGL